MLARESVKERRGSRQVGRSTDRAPTLEPAQGARQERPADGVLHITRHNISRAREHLRRQPPRKAHAEHMRTIWNMAKDTR